MKNLKTLLSVIIILVVIVLIVLGVNSKEKNNTNTNFKVGAVLPLTGAAALWGETVKNGMELALEKNPKLEIIYGDSKSTAVDGISAYNMLQNENVDLTFAELSLIAVPLSKIALERKLPLLVSLVAAEHSVIVNDYTTRYYTDPTNYTTPTFTDPISPVISAKKLAVLTRNDDLGNSTKNKIIELAKINNKEIVFMESFIPGEKDYNTAILKVKNSGADVFIFVPANPGEALGIVKTANQLKINMPMIETSAVFADLDTRKQAGNVSFYSTSYDFSLPNKAIEFKKEYKERFGKEPNFGSAFGYDIVNLISKCKEEKDDIKKCFSKMNEIEGVAGIATQVLPGDFTVKMHLEKVN